MNKFEYLNKKIKENLTIAIRLWFWLSKGNWYYQLHTYFSNTVANFTLLLLATVFENYVIGNINSL